MEKRVDCSLLLSFYGSLLTERQRELMRYYYEDDLSLSEIAALSNVSRQGAHDAIRRGEKQLLAFEERLGLRARWERMCEALRGCRNAIVKGMTGEALLILEDILRAEEEQDGL